MEKLLLGGNKEILQMTGKQIRREEFEIMAPVGSFESLMAAIQGGADAVYFGLEKLNMRSRSSVNFTESDLDKILKICSKNNIKSYLTLNIVLYDNELNRMRELVDLAKEKGITAIIASDHAVINYANQCGVEVHISTQVNISNTESLKFYSKYADVIVLARELNMDHVKEIHKSIIEDDIRGPSGNLVRIEMFAHGALCMSISGKCYLSLHEQNYSANRGACLQNCRKGYIVKEKESGRELEIDNEYIMSPKDLSTIHFLNQLIDAGVRVFKIEGRARPPEYVKRVTQCYDEAIKSIVDGSYNRDKILIWQNQLKTVFNRGFWDGYYLGQRLGEWSHVYGSEAIKRKTYVGKVTNYFSKIKVAEVLCEASELDTGDEILIMGPTTGLVEGYANEIRVDLTRVHTANKGDRFSIPVNQLVRRSDKLYKLT